MWCVMACSIEGEGLLYDGEDKNWPDPQSWNDEQIFSWMVRWVLVRHIKIWYYNGKNTHKRSKRDLYHTRIYLLPRGYPHSLTPRSIFLFFSFLFFSFLFFFVLQPHKHNKIGIWIAFIQLWKAAETGDADTMRRMNPKILEKTLDEVCLCACVRSLFT